MYAEAITATSAQHHNILPHSMLHTTATPSLSTPTTPAITSTPSISSSAVLIDLSISVWTGRKMDKRASLDVTSQNNAAKGVASVSKRLLGDCAELDALQKFAANARNIHYAMTMPWSDLGMRLCPTRKYIGDGTTQGYERTMTELQTEFARLTDTFLNAYEWEIQNAQLKLGDLFSQDEYPTRQALESKFRFRFTALPLPDAGDWRLDIGNEAAQSLKQQYEKFYGDQLKTAMSDVWNRAYDALVKMSERLDYADGETKKIFRDSLVTNVQEIADLLQTCNITNDPVMTEAHKKLDSALQGVTPEALREDSYLRAQTKRRVDEVKKIIDNLPGLGM